MGQYPAFAQIDRIVCNEVSDFNSEEGYTFQISKTAKGALLLKVIKYDFLHDAFLVDKERVVYKIWNNGENIYTTVAFSNAEVKGGRKVFMTLETENKIGYIDIKMQDANGGLSVIRKDVDCGSWSDWDFGDDGDNDWTDW